MTSVLTNTNDLIDIIANARGYIATAYKTAYDRAPDYIGLEQYLYSLKGATIGDTESMIRYFNTIGVKENDRLMALYY